MTHSLTKLTLLVDTARYPKDCSATSGFGPRTGRLVRELPLQRESAALTGLVAKLLVLAYLAARHVN